VTAPVDTALRQRVFDSMEPILRTVLGHPVQAPLDGTELMGDLGLRSATTLELLLLLEDALEIQIDVDEIGPQNVTTIGDLADYIASHSITD
jgi:acyl carrier protein